MAFGDANELYVADSPGSNAPVEKPLADKPHSILRLVDADGDGRFDKRTVFADKMMFPEGTMWLGGTGFEAVITAGMDNPVDVVFTPDGERFLCGTFLQNPRTENATASSTPSMAACGEKNTARSKATRAPAR